MAVPCTVSGNLQTLTGGALAQGQGKVIFQLANFGAGAVPRIIGTSLLPITLYTAQTDSTGGFSVSIWGNDNIDPSGTYYGVTFMDSLGNQVGPVAFSIVGSTLNLNSATPLASTTPPIFSQIWAISGTALINGNFGISGWGTGSSISALTGSQTGFYITITAGTTPSVDPTITLTLPIAYAHAPLVLAQMVGGTGAFSDVSVSSAVGLVTLTFLGLPVNGRTYQFAVFEVGL